MQARTFAILAAVFVLIFVINLIRKQKMTFKYSTTWFGACLAVLFIAVNDRILYAASKWAGFTLPSNFVFFLLLLFVVILGLLLTVYVNEQNNRTESLAQTVAILEEKINKLQDRR